MRIGVAAMTLETANDFRTAGVARYTTGLVNALAALPDPGHEFVIYANQKLEVPALWRDAPHFTMRTMWPRYNRWMLLTGGAATVRDRLDFLFSTAHTVPGYGPAPCGMMVHDLFPLSNPEWFREDELSFYRSMLPRSVARARILTANSEATKRETVARLGVPPERIVVTPLGPGNVVEPLDPASVSDDDLERLGVPFRRYLFALGTLEPRKNLPALFEAFGRIADRPEFADVGLVVGGGQGWKVEGILERLAALGIERRVQMLGYVPDEHLSPLFARCAAYVCPSLDEGFGMPVLEALQTGARVLCSGVGAFREVGGDVATYFPPTDIDAMAEVMAETLRQPSDPALRERAIARGRGFSWERVARETVAAIEGTRAA